MLVFIRRTVTVAATGQKYDKQNALHKCDGPGCCNFFDGWLKSTSEFSFCSRRCSSESKRASTERGKEIGRKVSASKIRSFQDPVKGSILSKKLSDAQKRIRLKDPNVDERRKKAFIAKHGKSSIQLMCEAFLKKYEKQGITHPSQLPRVRESASRNMRKLHEKGVIKERIESKYGVSNVMSVPGVHDKFKKSMIENHGVACTFRRPDIVEKAHCEAANEKRVQTFLKNFTWNQSKPEERLYQTLCSMFGFDDVKRQVLMNGKWAIDFHIKSINTYVQYDSYWHGYNHAGELRELKEVAEFKTKQDRGIHAKMLTDIEQNEWFAEQGLKLVRIVCNDYLEVEKIKACLMSNR